jgi:hypothetical protein
VGGEAVGNAGEEKTGAAEEGRVSDQYVARRIEGDILAPIVAFREYIFRDVLPAFGNINERAQQVADDYYNLIAALPRGEFDEIGMADVAEDAQEESHSWWEMMTSLRQTMLNLTAAGLFHLLEQRLALLTRDAIFSRAPLAEVKWKVIRDWYSTHLHVDLMGLPAWVLMDELRLVANSVKHGEGVSARELRAIRPELFRDPFEAMLFPNLRDEVVRPIVVPLSADEFFVTEEFLKMYADGAETFLRQIGAYLRSESSW